MTEPRARGTLTHVWSTGVASKKLDDCIAVSDLRCNKPAQDQFLQIGTGNKGAGLRPKRAQKQSPRDFKSALRRDATFGNMRKR
jgi:hypothetical protein